MVAFGTSNVKATLVRHFLEGATLVPDTYRVFTRFYQDRVAALRIAAITGLDVIPDWTDGVDITTKDFDSTGALDIDYELKAVEVRLKRYDVMDVPNLIKDVSRKMGAVVGYTYDKTAYATLAGAFGDTNTVDGKDLCATDHSRAGSLGDRSNKLTAALDHTSFWNAIKAMRQFTNYQGQYTRFADGGLCLVVPPELEQTAIELLKSQYSTTADSSGNSQFQYNGAQGMNVQMIVSPHLSDANDWFLITTDLLETPMKLWERSAPNFTIDLESSSRYTKLAVDFAIKSTAGPQPDGIIGSSVSG